jgi:transposase
MIIIAYVKDVPRFNRPKKVTIEVEEQVIKAISKNSTTRQLSTQAITNLVSSLVYKGIFARTVYRILHRKGYKPYKPITKLGLTADNKLKWL